MQIFASFNPLWGQISGARSDFVLLIHQICSFLPPQGTGANKNLDEKNGVLEVELCRHVTLKVHTFKTNMADDSELHVFVHHQYRVTKQKP